MKFNFFGKKEKRSASISYEIPSNFSDALQFGQYYNRTTAQSISAVYRATELISDSIAMLPIIVQGKDKEVLENHPLDLIFKDKGNQLISKFNLMKLLIQSVILKGNGFALINRAADGTVMGIRYLETGDVTIHFDKRKNEVYYTTTVTNKKIEPINMIHLVKNSYNGIEGISVLSYASRSLGICNNTENTASSFFQNGANLAGIITVQGQISAKQKEDIRNSWNQTYGNGGGSGIAVMPSSMTYQPIQLAAKDAQMIESRQFNVQDIARFFSINPALLGDNTHSSFSTLEAVQQSFLLHTLQPYISMIESEFNRKLLKPSESDLHINLVETYLLKSDKSATASYYNTFLSNGTLSINEVRKELGYQPIGDEGNKHLIAYTKIEDNTITNENNEVKEEVEDEKNL